MIESMTPDIYQSLKRAVELGKWPDGQHNSLQAIIAWGERHLPETDRVGYIDKGHKDGDSCGDSAPQPLNWKE